MTMASSWKKRITRPATLLRQARPRSSPSLTLTSTPASEAVRRFDEEAEKCLRDLEFEANFFDRFQRGKSPADEIMQTSTTTTTTTSTQNASSPDLLGTFCHLMHCVVHLRRENRHLRKQVLCLHEMRQIEKLQNELLRSACTCETGATAAAALVDKVDDESKCQKRKDHRRHSMPDGVPARENSKDNKSSMENSNCDSLADVTAAVTSRGGAPRIRSSGEEFVEEAEKRSFDGGQKPPAPVTACANEAFAAVTKNTAQHEQHKPYLKGPRPSNLASADSAKNIHLLSPCSSGESGAKPPRSDRYRQDSVGKADDGRSNVDLISKSLLSPPSSLGRRSLNGQLASSDRYVRDGAQEALADASDDRNFLQMHSSIGEDSISYSPRSMSSAGSSLIRGFRSGQMPKHELGSPSSQYAVSPTSVTDSDDVTSLKTKFFLSPRYSDSDQDQCVFSEVQLPDYRRDVDRVQLAPPLAQSTPEKSKKQSASPRIWRYSDLSGATAPSNGAGEAYATLSLSGHEQALPQSCSAQKTTGILGRFGLKRPNILSKKRTAKTTSIYDVDGQQKTNLIAPLVSKSMYSEKSGSEKETRQPPRGQSVVDLQPDRWKLARKAFLKKRKRKISESDSLASSDASGKSYMTIELPDINYCRKPSYPPSIPIVTTVDVDSLSKNVTKDYARKMRQWQHERQTYSENQKQTISVAKNGKEIVSKMDANDNRLIRRVSQKGQEIKRGWLRRPKDVDSKATVDESESTGRYFEHDDGRQNTVVENDVSDKMDGSTSSSYGRKPPIGWSASDSDISKKFDEVGPMLCGPDEQPKRHSQQQQLPREESPRGQKLRSVTFLEQLSPAETTASQQLTTSNDSVFTSQDADLHCCRFDRFSTTAAVSKVNKRIEQEQRQQQQTSDVVEQLLVLQERNSLLIRTLKDKTKEYELITERLFDLEKEIQTLRDKQRFDDNLEQLYSAVVDPNLVPISFVQDVEKQVEQLDNDIRVIKSEAYETQQLALETHANDQATTMRYLNQVDSLQKANFHLLSKTLSELNHNEFYDIRRQLELLPTYEALYCFTVNLLRKLKEVRTKLFEKNFSVSKLDLELLQTQSSLLLAHAQIERHKMEVRFLKDKYDICNTGDTVNDKRTPSFQLIRRTHSYHGQDLLTKMVNAELSFYLPFKLHGFHTTKRDKRHSAISFYHGDENLELEFAKLFDTVNRLSGHYDEIQIPLRNAQKDDTVISNRKSVANDPKQSQNGSAAAVEMRMRWRQRGDQLSSENADNVSRSQQRPISCNVPVKETEVKKIAEEIAAGRYFMSNSANSTQIVKNIKPPPHYLKKAPPPLKLGNFGQVKAIAAAFDGTVDDSGSAPNTPLAKAAPQLRKRVVVKEAKLVKSAIAPASRLQGMKPASHRTEYDRSTETSRIPTRANVGQRLQSPNTKLTSRTESPYETLTFLCRESNVASPPPSFSQLSPSTSCSVGLMDKSMSPDVETMSSTTSTAGSTWSISKRNEAKKLQFLYGFQPRQQQYLHEQRCPELPKSPVPPSSPTPRTPPTPIPPTPTPPVGSSRFPEFTYSHAQAPRCSKNVTKGKEKGPGTATVFGQAPVEKLKKPSWFQKLRHKN